MTGMHSNGPLLSADIHRLVSKVLAVWPGEGPSLACAPMLFARRPGTNRPRAAVAALERTYREIVDLNR